MTQSERRSHLIKAMLQHESTGISCKGCAGTCCTYEANSMMITPLEALELYQYLKDHDLLTSELKDKLQQTIKTYRLDHTVSTGRGTFLRRTYTCPFFGHGELGCPLPRGVKPYGCLGFNTHHAEIKSPEYCYSDIKLLQEREALYQEQEDHQNKVIKEKFGLTWEKSTLPQALLEFWERL